MPSTPSSVPPERTRRRGRLTFLAVGVLGALMFAGIGAWALATADSDSDPPGTVAGGKASSGVADVGDQAPDFELDTLDGKTIRLSDFRGQPVVVNFWASWCNPCREEFPLLKELRAEHDRDELAIVGVTFRDIESDSRDFVEDMDAHWPHAVDGDGVVAQSYGVRSPPITFFVDADGVIAARLFGFSSDAAFDAPLDRILRA